MAAFFRKISISILSFAFSRFSLVSAHREGLQLSPPYVKPRCRFETVFETPTFIESNNFAQLADVRTAPSNAPVWRRIQCNIMVKTYRVHH